MHTRGEPAPPHCLCSCQFFCPTGHSFPAIPTHTSLSQDGTRKRTSCRHLMQTLQLPKSQPVAPSAGSCPRRRPPALHFPGDPDLSFSGLTAKWGQSSFPDLLLGHLESAGSSQGCGVPGKGYRGFHHYTGLPSRSFMLGLQAELLQIQASLGLETRKWWYFLRSAPYSPGSLS